MTLETAEAQGLCWCLRLQLASTAATRARL
jgi:hypothetical protein